VKCERPLSRDSSWKATYDSTQLPDLFSRFLLLCSTFILSSQSAPLKVSGLKCEYRSNPLGLDTAKAAPQLAA